jgi:hypothetical protein
MNTSPLASVSAVVGALAPYAFELVIGSDAEGFDLTQVTAGVFEVLGPSARNAAPYPEWVGVISDKLETAGGTQLTLTHEYQAGDLLEAGTLYIRARLTHPDGAIYSRAVPLIVNGF